VALVAIVAGLPESWGRALSPELTRGAFIVAAAALYAMVCAGLSRNPKAGVMGALAVATVAIFLRRDSVQGLHWGFQTFAAFLLAHSLRWDDWRHPGAVFVRAATAVCWIGHAFLWLQDHAALWMPATIALPVVIGWLAVRFFGAQPAWAILVSSALVALSGPINLAAGYFQGAPAGVLLIAGSFIFFGAGTVLALTRHRWHQTTPVSATPDQGAP
jgi:hypothetical protein